MKVHMKRFLRMVERECGSIGLFCREFGMERTELATMLMLGLPFGYDESRRIINAFGAKKMIKVIDWEGMHVRCPI